MWHVGQAYDDVFNFHHDSQTTFFALRYWNETKPRICKQTTFSRSTTFFVKLQYKSLKSYHVKYDSNHERRRRGSSLSIKCTAQKFVCFSSAEFKSESKVNSQQFLGRFYMLKSPSKFLPFTPQKSHTITCLRVFCKVLREKNYQKRMFLFNYNFLTKNTHATIIQKQRLVSLLKLRRGGTNKQ